MRYQSIMTDGADAPDIACTGIGTPVSGAPVPACEVTLASQCYTESAMQIISGGRVPRKGTRGT